MPSSSADHAMLSDGHDAMVGMLARCTDTTAEEHRRITEVTHLGRCTARWPPSRGCARAGAAGTLVAGPAR